MILTCTCTNAFQDATYGKFRRVHSLTKQNGPISSRRWRCSVCGTERDGPKPKDKERE